MSKQKTVISPEQLTANGWKSQKDKLIPFVKRLDYIKGKGYMVLWASRSEDPPGFGFILRLPGGDLINLRLSSMAAVNAFEKAILSYEPNE
jgi:hypothetical protein